MGPGSDDGGFKCIKITLMILYILTLIGSVITVILAIYGLVVIPKDMKNQINAEIKDDKDLAQVGTELANASRGLAYMFLGFGLLWVVMSSVALYGIIKEILWIVVMLAVFGVIGVIVNAVRASIFSAIWALVVTVLTGLYARRIREKNLMDFDNKA